MKFNNSGEIMKIMTLECINHKGSHAQVACQSKVRERKVVGTVLEFIYGRLLNVHCRQNVA